MRAPRKIELSKLGPDVVFVRSPPPSASSVCKGWLVIRFINTAVRPIELEVEGFS